MSNLLPMETFRQIIGYHPFHFYGIADNSSLAVTSSCNALVKEYSWQDTDAAGRADIIAAIETAETRLREYLGYSIAPRYAEATLEWPRFLNATQHRTWSAGSDGRRLSVQLPEGHVQALGIEATSVISAGVAVTYSDQDGDGYNDTFTISAATTVTDTAQIAVYFAAADRYDGSAISDRWRIRPIKVSISAGTVTITGPAWLLVRPVRYQGVTNIGTGLAPSTTAAPTGTIYATTLDIYRRYTNTDGTTTATSQGVMLWETEPAAGYSCCGSVSPSSAYSGSPYDPAAIAQAVARVGIRDAERGIVLPAEAAYDSTLATWSALDWSVCAEPDRVTIRYLAGVALQSDGQMANTWQTIVARLAAAELARPVCACDTANRELYRWQFDLARTGGAADESFGAVSQDDLNNPLGTRRGHVYAYRAIKNLKMLRGFLPG